MLQVETLLYQQLSLVGHPRVFTPLTLRQVTQTNLKIRLTQGAMVTFDRRESIQILCPGSAKLMFCFSCSIKGTVHPLIQTDHQNMSKYYEDNV